jgi:hypothetical protein
MDRPLECPACGSATASLKYYIFFEGYRFWLVGEPAWELEAVHGCARRHVRAAARRSVAFHLALAVLVLLFP